MTETLAIALAQINPTVGDIDGNLDRIRAARAEAAETGADLVICGELAVSGYPPEDLVLKRAFQDGNASPAEAHAAIVKQVCDYTLSANCHEAGWPTRHGVQAWRGAARGPDAR